MFSKSQWQAFTPSQIGYLNVDQLGGLSSQVSWLSSGQIGGIAAEFWTSPQWLSVAPSWFSQLTPRAASALAPAAFHGLTRSVVAGLPGAIWHVVSAMQLNALTADAWGDVTAAEIAQLPKATVVALGQSSLQAIPTTAISGLAVWQLTPDQTGWLTSAQLLALVKAQVGALNAAQIAAISAGFWPSATATFLGAIAPTAIAKLSPAWILGLTPLQLSELSPAQTSALTAGQIAAISVGDPGFWAAASPAWIGAIAPTAIASVGVPALLALSPEQIAALTTKQIRALSTLAGFWTAVSAGWLNSLSDSALTGLGTAAIPQLQPATIAQLDPRVLGDLSAADWRALTATQTAELTAAQFQYRLAHSAGSPLDDLSHPTALNAIVVAGLTAAVLSSTQASVFSRFDAQWLNALPKGALASLSAAQIQAILPRYIPYLDTALIGSLSPDQIGALTPAQVRKLTAADFQSMTPAAAQALKPTDLAKLAGDQLIGVDVARLFTNAQIAASAALQTALVAKWTVKDVEAAGIANLTNVEIRALTPAQIFSLSSRDVASFSRAQLFAMTRQQLATIYNLSLWDKNTDFDLKAIAATPAELASLAADWKYVPASFAPGTLGDPAIWSHLTPQQVGALWVPITAQLRSRFGEEGFAVDTPASRAMFNSLEQLPVASFAALVGQAPQSYLLFISYNSTRPLTTAQIDSLPSTYWSAAVEWDRENNQAAAVTYFESQTQTQRSAWWVYNQNQTNPGWLASNPDAVSGLTVNQLGALSDAQVQGLSVAQLDSLSSNQYAALHGRLTTAQVEALLNQEIAALPTASQTAYRNSGPTRDIENLLNPHATPGQLFGAPFDAADVSAAQTIIGIYDDNFAQIANHPNHFKEFTDLYDLLQANSDAKIAHSANVSQINADVTSILNDFTLYNTALRPTVAPGGGSTDVKSYVQQVADTLSNATGGLIALQSDLAGLATIETNVSQLVLDNTTVATPTGALLQWALDGSPNQDVPAGQGALTYNNLSGLTFEQALEHVELDLFTNADNFVQKASAGIAQVVSNKTVADEQALINQILDIVSVAASIGGGIASVASTLQSAVKAGLDIAKSVSQATSAISGLTSLGKTMYGYFATPSSSGQYSNLTSAGGYVAAVVDDLTANLTSGDATAGQAIAAANQFSSDYRSLIATIAKNLRQGTTVLGEQTLSDQALKDAFKTVSANGTPIHDQMTYTSPDGVQHIIVLNLADVFGTMVPPPAGTRNRDWGIEYVDWTEPGPVLPGFDSTTIHVRTQRTVSGTFAPDGPWSFVGVNLEGHNPV